MLTMVEARTDQGTLLQLPLGDISEGLAVANIDGLDPVKATLVSSNFAQQDGAQYESSRRETRNIMLTISYEPDYTTSTVQDLRRRLYSFFMPEEKVYLRFIMDNGLSVDITGRIESFDSPQFTEKPSAIISILCFNPDFTDVTENVVNGSTVEDNTEIVIDYEGTVPSGIVFELAVDRTLDEFTIYHFAGDGVQRYLQFNAPMVSGDVLTISTVPGAKAATLVGAGGESSVLWGVLPGSNWISLRPGDNNLRIYAEGAAVPYTITYTDKYGGL